MIPDKIIIQPKISLSELKRQFSHQYPYLKLEFFNKSHEFHGGNLAKNMIRNTDVKIEDISKCNASAYAEIKADLQVGKFEIKFQEQFNLGVQVFKKSRGTYIETTRSDDFTFGQLNKAAQEYNEQLSEDLSTEDDQDVDYFH